MFMLETTHQEVSMKLCPGIPAASMPQTLPVVRRLQAGPKAHSVWLTETNGSRSLEELTVKSRVLTEGTESV